MNNVNYERFHKYLCEVVSYYQDNGTLRGFSVFEKKWRVKGITKDKFYANGLHLIQNGDLPSLSVSKAIRDSILQAKRDEKSLCNNGDIIAWERNGCRSIAVVGDDGMFDICLNYRGRVNEKDKLWYIDSIPTDVEIECATTKDMKVLIKRLTKKAIQL